MYGTRRFKPRRRFGAAGGRLKKVQLSRNHCEMTIGPTTGGTESQTVLIQTVSAPTNRSTQVEIGSVLRRVTVRLWATNDPTPAGKHQCILMFRPGASALPTPIAAWFDTTDPLTEDAIDIRREVMERHGVTTKVIAGTIDMPLMFICSWKGRRLLRDGDDVVLTILDGTATTYTGTCDYSYEDA